MSPRNHKLSPRIDGRLAAYATLAGAALAAPAMVQNANADIVYSGIVNYNIPSTTSGIYLNVVTGVTAITPGGAPGWDLNPWSSSGLEIWGNNSASPNDGVLDNFPGGAAASVDNIPFGTLVDGTYNYGRSDSTVETTGPTAFNLNSSNNLFGFRFLNESTGVYDFGWARVSLSGTLAGQPRMVVEYAYENTGAPIAAGVPEPSTFALLGVMAAGAFGVRAWRKRKNS
jgi:hypothetical protein